MNKLARTAQPKTDIPRNAPFSWIILSLLISYIINLALVKILWAPDLIALWILYWVIHQPNRISFFVAFILGILMDVHNGSVLGQQSLVYITLTFMAHILSRRILCFGIFRQALHVLPLLLLAQCLALIFRLWFDGLWPGVEWFLQSILGACIWPLIVFFYSKFFRFRPIPEQH